MLAMHKLRGKTAASLVFDNILNEYAFEYKTLHYSVQYHWQHLHPINTIQLSLCVRRYVGKPNFLKAKGKNSKLVPAVKYTHTPVDHRHTIRRDETLTCNLFHLRYLLFISYSPTCAISACAKFSILNFFFRHQFRSPTLTILPEPTQTNQHLSAHTHKQQQLPPPLYLSRPTSSDKTHKSIPPPSWQGYHTPTT